MAQSTDKDLRILAGCCAAMIVGSLVGVVSHCVLRPIVQTSPPWIAIVCGVQGSALAKVWASLLVLCLLAVADGGDLALPLGWARITGRFSLRNLPYLW